MVETGSKFTKQPRRKTEKGKRVVLSPEARQAYEEQIKARTEREENYLRHLPPREPK
jgi:DNA-binding MarR family transcriptional regulator